MPSVLYAATRVTRSSVSVCAKLPARGFTSGVVEGFTAAVGNTPLVNYSDITAQVIVTIFLQIHLKSLSERTGSVILGKAEFQNPGGSVKDRAALGVVRDAEEKGRYVSRHIRQNING